MCHVSSPNNQKSKSQELWKSLPGNDHLQNAGIPLKDDNFFYPLQTNKPKVYNGETRRDPSNSQPDFSWKKRGPSRDFFPGELQVPSCITRIFTRIFTLPKKTGSESFIVNIGKLTWLAGNSPFPIGNTSSNGGFSSQLC